MKRSKWGPILHFYGSFAAITITVSLFSAWGVFKYGTEILFSVLLLKTLLFLLIYAYIRYFRQQQQLYYYNLQLKPFELWMPAILIDLCLLLVLISPFIL